MKSISLIQMNYTKSLFIFFCLRLIDIVFFFKDFYQTASLGRNKVVLFVLIWIVNITEESVRRMNYCYCQFLVYSLKMNTVDPKSLSWLTVEKHVVNDRPTLNSSEICHHSRMMTQKKWIIIASELFTRSYFLSNLHWLLSVSLLIRWTWCIPRVCLCISKWTIFRLHMYSKEKLTLFFWWNSFQKYLLSK